LYAAKHRAFGSYGHQVDKGWVVVDAGWMAMSRDRGTQRQRRDYGYGAVCDSQGEIIDGYILGMASQEHGIVCKSDGSAVANIARLLPIGSLLRILPNHACATGAQFSEYNLVGDSQIVKKWPRFNGW
jgi:D-serine deaminase-like pyridoxal phosphate-dependent protein